MGDTELLCGLEDRLSYLVKSIFDTIQGEGYYAGTPATFVRLAACNLWSGHEKDRQRDHERNEAECPQWCDTDFVGGELFEADEILARVNHKHIVITGGEPLLQVDHSLLTTLIYPHRQMKHRVYAVPPVVQIESNGTAEPSSLHMYRRVFRDQLYITISPKTAPDALHPDIVAICNEVKVVYPSYDPKLYEDLATRRYIQPLADGEDLNPEHMQAAAEFVMANPGWKLSVQTHKVVGLD